MKKSILVIDDEQPTLNMFQLLLGAYGYAMLSATNGAEGLDIFTRERPSLVLTDVKMPGMDGLEVLRRIKALDPQAEVVVITGHGDMDMAIQALNLGATDFIDKPVQRQALSQALKNAEERIALARSMAEAVDVEDSPESAILSIKGSVTAGSEPFLTRAFERACAFGRARVLLRFDESASANGAGLALLIQLLLAAKERGQRVGLDCASESFRKVFAIVGISKLLDAPEPGPGDAHQA